MGIHRSRIPVTNTEATVISSEESIGGSFHPKNP